MKKVALLKDLILVFLGLVLMGSIFATACNSNDIAEHYFEDKPQLEEKSATVAVQVDNEPVQQYKAVAVKCKECEGLGYTLEVIDEEK